MTSKADIVVVPLTSELTNLLKAKAAVALNGDGSCSLKAMSMSCFASEACARNQFSSMKLDVLLRSPHKFVAMVRDTDEFVGCVSAETKRSDRMISHYFPRETLPSTAVILYNLCVSQEYRGCGAGRKLVQAIVDTAASPRDVYLLVSRLNPNEKDPDKAQIYKDRITRLLNTYNTLEFDVQCDCPDCFLLRHR